MDPQPALQITKRLVNDVAVLTLSGQVRLEDGDEKFREYMDALVHEGQLRIVVDLGGVTAIDSSGLAMLTAKLKSLRAHGGDIRLVHLTNRSQKLLAIMKLISVFRTFEDEDSAVKSFQ